MKSFLLSLLVVLASANLFAQDSLNVTRVGHYQTPDRAWGVVLSGIYAYVADVNSGLRIINVENPAAPAEAGFYVTPGSAFSVAVSGNYAYVTDLSIGLRIINISNPSTPTLVSSFNTEGDFNAYAVAVSGDFAYVANFASGLRIINITNPTVPTEEGFYLTPYRARSVAVSGTYAYVADDASGLRVINITNPSAPTEAGFYDTPGEAYGVALSGSYAYVADGEFGLRIINISNPATPFEEGFFDTQGYARGVAVEENYAYVADEGSGLRVINVTNPAAPTEAGFYNTPGAAWGVAASVDYIYVGDWTGGLGIYSFLPSSLTPGILITRPDSGETFQIQTTETIEWTSSNYSGNVQLELNRSFPNGEWENISANTANDGTETWVVTGPSSVNCRVRVSAVDDTLSDTSDSDFSIIPFLDLISPNIGTTWNVYQMDTVRWESGGLGNVMIELNRHFPIGEWEVIADLTENDGEYEWFVTDPLSDSCRIRICALADTFCDVSDGNFSIVSSQGYLALVRSAQTAVPLTSWNFGDIECPQTGAQWFRFKNFGSESIVVFQSQEPVSNEFSRTTSCGAFFALAPNQESACSVRVDFDPASDGVYADVLRVQTDAVNGVNGFVEFALLGEQVSTPAAPEVVIQTAGLDAQLAWSVVDTSVGGCAVSGLWYAVFYSPTSGGPFYYHGWTTDTSYTHYGVLNFSAAQFYEVLAVVGPTAVAAGLERGMEMGEVLDALRPLPLTPSP